MAHAFIDAIADAGADAVKLQTHIASAESTPNEPWRIQFSLQDETRYDYWRRMEFTEPQWHDLKQHATDRGLLFVCSPFSDEAVDLLSRVGVHAWKIASGEVNNVPMLERIAETELPVILSSGMNPISELDAAMERLDSYAIPLAVTQCTSRYPCPPEHIGLNVIPEFRDRYECAVGLSDHSGTIYPGLAAATLGIEVLEVHVTLSREMFGPDVSSSITTTELKQLNAGVRFIETMMANPVDKDELAEDLGSMRSMFTKSVHARYSLPAGTVLQMEHLAMKKPGSGIPASDLDRVINRKLRRTVTADTMLGEDDFEN
jgi:N-acetylneuraminate synthase